jgi:hypothetical protein
MRAKRTKAAASTSPAVPSVDVAPGDRAALIAAYQAGVITAWKRDPERGYRLSLAGQPDDYVEVGELARYLARLGAR